MLARLALSTVFSHVNVSFAARFDSDGNGTLGATEMVALMKHIGKTQQQAEAAIAEMDEDGNGEVSIEEFRAAAVQGKLGTSNAMEMKATFDIFDLGSLLPFLAGRSSSQCTHTHMY
jgi:hypothetical protein